MSSFLIYKLEEHLGKAKIISLSSVSETTTEIPWILTLWWADAESEIFGMESSQ